MPRPLFPFFLLLAYISVARTRPAEAQLSLPRPPQRLVVALPFGNLVTPPAAAAPVTPIITVGPLPSLSRPRSLGRTLRMELTPAIAIRVGATWWPSGGRTTVGLVLTCF